MTMHGEPLRVCGVHKAFGGVVAVNDLSFDVAAGTTLGVIGPNGAGKSTLLKLIAGEYPVDRGKIWLGEQRLDHRPPHRVARAGVALAHQVPRPFKGLTVRENLRVGAFAAASRAREARGEIDAVLALTGLSDKGDRRARDLALLDLKRLGLARALAQAPRLLLLDEVGAGLVPSELEVVIDIVRGVQKLGVTILVVEHVESVIGELAERVLVLDWGRLLADGSPEQVAANEQVRAVYLGDGQSSTGKWSGRPRGGPLHAPLLKLGGISARYGGALALDQVDLEIDTGEVVAVVGANGAGKTTLARVVSGLKHVDGGGLAWRGTDVTRTPPHRRVQLGIAHCQEGRRVFADLTVRENLLMGSHVRRAREREAASLGRVEAIFPAVREHAGRLAGLLSGGQQGMLAIGRALMSDPTLLVLDEVSLGLAPMIVDQVYESIQQIRESRVAVLLIEQAVFKSLAIADHVYVLDHGRVVFSGSPSEFGQSTDLAQLYFGRGVSSDRTRSAIAEPSL